MVWIRKFGALEGSKSESEGSIILLFGCGMARKK